MRTWFCGHFFFFQIYLKIIHTENNKFVVLTPLLHILYILGHVYIFLDDFVARKRAEYRKYKEHVRDAFSRKIRKNLFLF